MTNRAFIGMGGCGMNMLEDMADGLPEDACTIGINRDAERMSKPTNIRRRILLDELSATDERGDLFPAGKAEMQTAMQCHWPELEPMLHAADSICILAGLGGATGSWGSEFMLQHVNDLEKQTIMIAVEPFRFETRRCEVAKHVLEDLRAADCLLVFSNQQMLNFLPESSMTAGFSYMHQLIFETLNKIIGGKVEKGAYRISASGNIMNMFYPIP